MPGPGFDQVRGVGHVSAPSSAGWSQGQPPRGRLERRASSHDGNTSSEVEPDERKVDRRVEEELLERRASALSVEDQELQRSFKSHFDLLYHIAEKGERSDRNDVDVRKRMAGRYGNIMIVSALIFTVAAEGLLEPSDQILRAPKFQREVYGIFMGLAFAFTLAGVLCAAVMLGTIAIMPQALSRWYFQHTAILQKAPIMCVMMGCVFLWVAVSCLTWINFGWLAGSVLWSIMVILGFPLLLNYLFVMRGMHRRIREEENIIPPNF